MKTVSFTHCIPIRNYEAHTFSDGCECSACGVKISLEMAKGVAKQLSSGARMAFGNPEFDFRCFRTGSSSQRGRIMSFGAFPLIWTPATAISTTEEDDFY
ncbi:hypothetical protein CDAR_93871 [Caerostris darwini]|uniref:Uncharacterized protein n=1 Tax=Caerostris darwini TaxID=1538125 RepID=A0AAV4NMA4_9ARAC|nr:hypothetical protein CDAR_93871 [Caerostris darwini]